MKKIALISILLIIYLVFCHPVVALNSPAYQRMNASNKAYYDENIKKGDAFYNQGEYQRADEKYANAVARCPDDYYARAVFGRAWLARGIKEGDRQKINIGRESLGEAEAITKQQGTSPYSYEYNDFLAKTRMEQAKALVAMGDEKAASIVEDEANRYREVAEDAKRKEGIPLSPFVALAGIGLVAIWYRYCRG